MAFHQHIGLLYDHRVLLKYLGTKLGLEAMDEEGTLYRRVFHELAMHATLLKLSNVFAHLVATLLQVDPLQQEVCHIESRDILVLQLLGHDIPSHRQVSSYNWDFYLVHPKDLSFLAKLGLYVCYT